MEKINKEASEMTIRPVENGVIVYIELDEYVFTDVASLASFVRIHFGDVVKKVENNEKSIGNRWLDLNGPDDVWGGGS